ncbi:acyl transferase/acyl hydrolase/lysophospholipase [Coniella lustricola]|uniref:Acyl transferase/acyl hydrolase/lysophospholipase n=1 Tax=Coniella lustricola TaxID=2025994 RepID=A0A2T3A9U8_9PEZI|nr:acyl transferase/acyl hydrolase/lysophospholipase [Coniella lustricola]
MTDFLEILPSFKLTQASSPPGADQRHESKQVVQKKSGYTASLPVKVLTELIRGANQLFLPLKDPHVDAERATTRRREEQRQILGLRMRNAASCLQWTAAAQELDELEGNNLWKSEIGGVDGIYRPDIIRARMRDLDEARTNCDIRRMVHLVRTALSRELGGMGNIDLYKHSYVGTKDLIEEYVQSAVQTIEDLVEKSGYPGALPDGLDQNDILGAFVQARQSFGRSALLLSGGGTFGMMHAGVLKAMYEADMLPRIICGASAGSIVCAVFCTRTREEIPEVIASFPYGDLSVFGESGKEESVLDHIKRLFTQGSWSDIKHLKQVMRDMLGDITFQEAYNRTRKICNISVSTESIYELPRLLNYITAPNVMIWSAVAASCSVPIIFNPAQLLVRDVRTGEHVPWNPTPQKWVDGSVDNDLPMTRLAEMFNVNHFIVSQVNPHVVPFMTKDERHISEHDGGLGPSQSASFTTTLTQLAKDEVLHRLHFLADLGIFPTAVTKLRSVLSQKYSGDITILPEFSLHDLPGILRNPTVDFMERSTFSGERATWPKLSQIRDRFAVELAIDRSIQILRTRCLFSQSQVNLRRLVTDPTSLSFNTTLAQGLYMSRRAESPQAKTHSLVDAAKLQKRLRRGSVGSLQPLPRHRKPSLEPEGTLTDDDTEEEQRLELSLRRGSAHALLSGRSNSTAKPRFRRGSFKALQPALLKIGPLTNPFPARDEYRGFDFAKPLESPANLRDEATTLHAPQAISATNSHGLIASPDIPRHSPQSSTARTVRSEFTSPTTGEPYTSDLHTTDADCDYRTEDTTSDPDPSTQMSIMDIKDDDDETAAATPRKPMLRPSTELLYVVDGLSDSSHTGNRHDSPSAAALADDEHDTTDTGGEGLWD